MKIEQKNIYNGKAQKNDSICLLINSTYEWYGW